MLMMREDGLHMLEPVLVTAAVVVRVVAANAIVEEVVFVLHVHLVPAYMGRR